MYLSPAVRTIRKDPTPGAVVTLLVRLDDSTDAASALEAVRASDGEVTKETRFDNFHVTLTEPEVAALLDAFPDTIEAVETVTSELSGDAGEDVEPPGVDP